jgi:hypothetical protein
MPERPPRRLILLAVHHRHPELLADQIERFRRCAAPLADLGFSLRFHPIAHRFTSEDIGRTVAALDQGRGIYRVRGIDLRGRQLMPRAARAHGRSLSAALQALWREKAVGFDDLIGIVDHDAHPLDASLLARLAAELEGAPDLAGIGVPQWHRGHCFLHPSLLLTRVGTIEEMGPSTAFEVRVPRTPDDETWNDTAEGFTLWCEEHGRRVLPLRVCSTAYPWSRWDSDMAPGTELTGWHGEPVRIGHLMRYGLEESAPLVSHLWSASYPWGPSEYPWDEVTAAYLGEPMSGVP